MKKSKLKDLNVMQFPRNIRLDSLIQGYKIEYIYAARKITVGQNCILEVDFFSFKEKKVSFRVFISKADFITQMLITEQKWSDSKLDNLIYYCNYNNNSREDKLVALNERSKKTIVSFLQSEIKNDIKHEKPLKPLDMIQSFQEKVRKGQLEKRHQKIKDRIDSEFISMDKMPEDINSWIEKYPLWNNQYIFYKRKGKKVSGYCSMCNSEVYPEYAKHKLPGVCPSCDCSVTFKAKGRSKNTGDKFVFSYIQKGINGYIIQRVFEGWKSYRNGFDKPHVHFYEARRYIYRDGKYQAYHHGDFKNTGEYRWCDGFPHKQMGYYTYSDTGSLYAANLREALQGTELRDCRLEKFAETKVHYDAQDYLVLYYKQPEIRFLVENGLYSLIFEVINNRGFGSVINIKPEIYDILADNKSFFPLFKEIGISANELELISQFTSKKYIKKDILLEIRRAGVINDLASVFRYATPVKALNYLAKQTDGSRTCKDVLILWLDYLRFAEFLGYDVNSSFVVFPSKLQREHDRINDEYGKLACLNGDEKISLMTDKLNELYGYENEMYLIRAPKNGKEIRDEGTVLRHCVGGYVDDMAKLKTFILFIRDKRKASKPFYTVEFKNNEIRQCHGYLHASETPEVKAFLEEWKKYLNKKEQKALAAA